MSKIKQLDAHTANMIAAGEVVERPMGVVKELVENAIDAGSTRIIVSIEEGGMKKLTVSDDGCGMDSEDAQMCFERHATSKIHSSNDLWSIHTLGFRGEALPSIASVARVTIRTSDGEDATQVVVAYGKKESAGPYPCNQGTEISVEGLFYQTPARLKHMRSASYEASLIQDVVQKFALSHPEISFRLINDGRDAFRTSGQSDLLEVMYAVFGRSAVENAVACSFEDFDYQVSGYVVAPNVTRASRNLMHIFLNGRMVRTYRLYKAVQDGYHGLIPDGRYPLCVLNIEMDPHLLDVNVHPSKWEVRISKEIQLELLLKEGVAKALHQEEIIPENKPEPMTYFQPISLDFDEVQSVSEKPSVNLGPVKKAASVAMNAFVKEEIRRESAQDEAVLRALHEKMEVQKIKEEEKEERVPLPQLYVIGQYRKRFILCETQKGLAIVDGHQARRRTAYEKILKQMDASTTMIDLLVPVTIHVSDDICARLDEINALLKDLSLQMEMFGEDTLLIRSIPSWMKDGNVESFMEDLLESIKDDTSASVIRDIRHKTAAALSADLSQKQMSMTMDEMKLLIDQLSECDNPYVGVSGGAIIQIVDDGQLMKGFSL